MIQSLETSLAMPARRVVPRLHIVTAPKPSIVRFVDAVDCPVAMTNRDGRVTAMNGPARDYFIGRTGTQLREEIESAARIAMTERRTGSEGSPNPARQFEIGHERFHATLVLAGNDVATQDIGVLIMLRRESIANAPQVNESALTRRFGLTPQEARVAIMLADQRSNREIADRLGVSAHTARHHTERVLSKLQIHSRYDVKRAIS
jgi:DNA-binding CsgD family transcriptional regulator